MFNTECYFDAAKKGDTETIIAMLNALYPRHTQKSTRTPYDRLPSQNTHHAHALMLAIQHQQPDVVLTLLNYADSLRPKIMFSDTTKLEAISEAIKQDAPEICHALIQHLTLIRPATYTSLRGQLSRHYSTSLSDDPSRQAYLSRLILALLQHPKLETHPRRPLETLRDIGIIHGCVDVIHFLLNNGLDLSKLSENDQGLIVFDLAESRHARHLFSRFPALETIFDNRIAPDNADTPFIAAARANNLNIMTYIYTKDTSQLERKNRDHQTALEAAAESTVSTKESMLWLLDHGLPITKPILKTIARLAAQSNTFQAIIANPNPDIDRFLEDNAFRDQLLEIVLSLYMERTEHTDLLTTPTAYLKPLFALYDRITHGPMSLRQTTMHARHYEHELLPKSGASAQSIFERTIHGQGLHKSSGFPINATDKQGQTALHHLMQNTPKQLVNYLINIAIDHPGSITPLIFHATTAITMHYVANTKRIKATLNKLMALKALINMPDNQGMTPLHFAVQHHSNEIVGQLLKSGARPNIQDHQGQTPLMLACQFGSLETIKLLLDHEADIDLKSNAGKNVLDYLKDNEHESQDDILRFLQNQHRRVRPF